jgi:preprotein translocase subunit SecF
MYSQFREKEPAIRKHDIKVLSIRPRAAVKSDAVVAASE